MKLVKIEAYIVGRDREADTDDYFEAQIEFTQGEIRELLTLLDLAMVESVDPRNIRRMAKLHEEFRKYSQKGIDLIYAEKGGSG